MQQQGKPPGISFTSQSSKHTGHRGVPFQCSGSGTGAVVEVATAAAALARATSARPRAGPSTTGGAAFGLSDGGGVGAFSHGARPLAAAAAFALTRRRLLYTSDAADDLTRWGRGGHGPVLKTHLSSAD